MRGNYIILDIKINFIKNFLDHNVSDAGAEIESIEKKGEAGEYDTFENYDRDLAFPFERLEMAARAAYYEINALIENELQEIARTPWFESDKYPGPKRLSDIKFNEKPTEDEFWDSISGLKSIHDLRFNKIIQIIKSDLGIDVKKIEGSEILWEIRNEVNAFKHRDGKVSHKDDPKKYFNLDWHHANIDKAYLALKKARLFIIELWKLS